MGLEIMLSRGASQVTFFERDPSAVKRLKQNIQTLGVEKSSKIISGESCFRGLNEQKTYPAEAGHAELVFF